MPAALLILDMQNYFFQTGIKRSKYPQLIASINELIMKFDSQEKGQVYYVISVHKADRSTWSQNMLRHNAGCLLEGTHEAEIVNDLKISRKQMIIPKTRHSAFIRTELEHLLRKNGVDQLVIAGVYTHGCIALTAIDAWSLDFKVVIASDCIFSHRPDLAEFCIERLQSMFHIEFLSNVQLEQNKII